MVPAGLNCPKCLRSWSSAPQELASLTACPACGSAVEVTLFPAFGRGPTVGKAGENRLSDTEAACFFHPAKKAIVPCDQCGRFLCALCDLELERHHYCPTCLNSKRTGISPRSLETERFRWDSLVWALVLIPPLTLLCASVTPITSALAIGLGVWKFNAPPSRIARSRLRLALGLFAASTVLAGSPRVLFNAFSHQL